MISDFWMPNRAWEGCDAEECGVFKSFPAYAAGVLLALF